MVPNATPPAPPLAKAGKTHRALSAAASVHCGPMRAKCNALAKAAWAMRGWTRLAIWCPILPPE